MYAKANFFGKTKQNYYLIKVYHIETLLTSYLSKIILKKIIKIDFENAELLALV